MVAADLGRAAARSRGRRLGGGDTRVVAAAAIGKISSYATGELERAMLPRYGRQRGSETHSRRNHAARRPGRDLPAGVFFFKQKTAYELGLGIPAEPLFRSYDQCFQSVQLLQWNSQVKFNVTVYRNLPTTRDSIMTS